MDRTAIQILFAFLPGLLWLSWIRRRDAINPEPVGLILRVFFLGCASAVVISELRPLVDARLPHIGGWRGHAVDAFLATALIEETVKGAAFILGALRHKELDEPCDGLIYGVAAGLGFASVENAFYLIATGDPMVVVLRSFTALLVHVGCSGLLGLALARARFGASEWRVWIVFLEVILLHGIYDLFLFAWPEMRLLSLLIALPTLLFIFSWHMRRACPRCHTSPDGDTICELGQ